MAGTIDYLTPLIRSAITGEKPILPGNADDRFEKIIDLSNAHQIAPIVSASLLKYGCISDEKHIKEIQKIIYNATYRDTKNNYTYNLAAEVLSRQKICFVPLKGVIIKQLYPESFMRPSCDIDILVHKSDFNKAVSALENVGFHIEGDLTFHDVSLLYDDSNLELHFSICENNKNLDGLLSNVWDYTVKSEDYKYIETNEYFMFHHIAHMAYHFLAGGCGIRPIIDYWILKDKLPFDEKELIKLCKKAGIDEFYSAVKQLTDVWFEGKKHTDITKRIEKYILVGGAYGIFPNNAAAYTVTKGGRTKYILSLVFPKYVNMKVLYPTLNKAPFLLPFFYFYRLFQKTVGRNSSGAKDKFRIIKGQGDDFVGEVAYLLKSLKLNK